MWAGVVVPGANVPQGGGEIFFVRNWLCRQRSLHCADKPLNPSILPETAGFYALMADAQQPETESEHAGDEYGLIVRPQEFWPTILFHGAQ